VAKLTTLEEPREEQADEELDETSERAPESSREERAAPAILCVYCGESLVGGELPRFSRGFGIVVLLMGILLSVFVLLLGLPLVVIGAYMTLASRSVWICQECGAVVDRHAT
jgi:hypothetical protein